MGTADLVVFVIVEIAALVPRLRLDVRPVLLRVHLPLRTHRQGKRSRAQRYTPHCSLTRSHDTVNPQPLLHSREPMFFAMRHYHYKAGTPLSTS